MPKERLTKICDILKVEIPKMLQNVTDLFKVFYHNCRQLDLTYYNFVTEAEHTKLLLQKIMNEKKQKNIFC